MAHEFIDGSEIEAEAGSNVTTLLGGEDHEFTFLRAYLEPGAASPPEDFVIHPDCDQLEYVLYGTGKAIYPDATYPLSPGVAVFHSAGQPHRFVNDSDEPLIYVVVTMVGEKVAADRVYQEQ